MCCRGCPIFQYYTHKKRLVTFQFSRGFVGLSSPWGKFAVLKSKNSGYTCCICDRKFAQAGGSVPTQVLRCGGFSALARRPSRVVLRGGWCRSRCRFQKAVAAPISAWVALQLPGLSLFALPNQPSSDTFT